MIAEQKRTVGLNQGGNPNLQPLEHDEGLTPTLADVGVSYDLSSRSQAIAAIPEDDFENTLMVYWRDDRRAEADGGVESWCAHTRWW
jgi:hypothetical protein